jgi:hypothetical protein
MLSYSYLSDNDLQNSSIPPRQSNGGRDTGAPASGPWGSIPVMPETVALSQNLLSAQPPPNAEKHPVSFNRPGNNLVQLPYHQRFNNDSTLLCMKK